MAALLTNVFVYNRCLFRNCSLDGKCSKISNTFLFIFSTKVLVIKNETQKMFVRIANREQPDQTASSVDLGLYCLSRPGN